MRTADYWAERFTALDDSIYKTSEKYARSLQTQFDRAKRTISRDLGYWYGRLAENNGISYAEAKKLLKDDELSEFKMTVAEYIKHGKEDGLDPEWIKRLENVSAKVHISRLEQIQTDLQQTVEGLYKSYETGAGELLQSVTMTSYYHTAYEVAKGTGIGVNLHRLDIDTVAGFLSRPWCQDGKVFSDRIWTRKDELVDSLNTLLAQNLMTGADPQKAIDELAKRFDVEKRAAGRLIMTETAAIQNEARQKCMKDLDVEGFEFVATLDSHTSTLCRGMDGQHFPMSQFKIGLNAPPLHCNCRSTTVPWFDDEFTADETRAAREAGDTGYKQVPSNMTYKEWEERYLSTLESETSESELGTFKKRILSDEEIDKKYYSVLKDKFSHGTDEAKRVFNKYVPADSVIDSKYEGTAIHQDGKIKMHFAADIGNRRGPGATWFHEHGHLIDYVAGDVSNNAKFVDSLQSEGLAFFRKYDYNYKEIGKLFTDTRSQSAVSDLFNALSADQVVGVGYHGRRFDGSSYWTPETVRQEAFAHMFEAQFDSIRYAEMKKYFPETLSIFEDILKGL